MANTEDSMPECDCINYLRHGSWYLEQIKVLEFTHPELNRRLSMWVSGLCRIALAGSVLWEVT